MQFGFLKATRKFGKAQLYSLNSGSELILKFKALDGELARQAMQKALGPIPAREPPH